MNLSSTNSKMHLIHLFSVLFVVGTVQVLELYLLERKYSIFTGGFLQVHSYLTWMGRVKFIGLSLWMDIFLFGAISLLWFRISFRRNAPPLVSTYNFIFFSISTMGTWLALKFKVLSYFNDTLDFVIIKNLGGGSLFEALSYVANEAIFFGLGLVFLVFVYWIGLHWAKMLSGKILINTGNSKLEKKRSCWGVTALGVAIGILTIILVHLINSDYTLRYGLNKKTSFILISNALDELTDFDMDGYGLFRFPLDPDSLDSSVYPGALDYPGNGLDEDGYGGDFEWTGPAIDSLAELPEKPGKHILLIVLESTRADLLGKTWNNLPATPNITKLAKAGTSVEYAYSHTGYTTSSIRALFSRTLSSHNNRVLLTDYLERSGYSLSIISGQDESFGGVATSTRMNTPQNYYFDARSALEDRVFPSKEPGSLRLSEDRILRQFNIRTEELDWKRPQFFYINLQAAHFPYSHPTMPMLIIDKPIPRADINEKNRSWLQATYWNAIANADNTIGAIIERLRQLGVYEDTVIVILGDHGESLFDDHFLGHGHTLNNTQTHIPLVINQPDLKINRAVGQIDIAELMIRVATDRFDEASWKDNLHAQLQFVGSLNKPQLVGIVSYGDIRTILDLRNRRVFFSDLERWEDFDKAIKDAHLGQRIKNLLQLWEMARWEEHLSQSGQK